LLAVHTAGLCLQNCPRIDVELELLLIVVSERDSGLGVGRYLLSIGTHTLGSADKFS
jgi:hypothetical protein